MQAARGLHGKRKTEGADLQLSRLLRKPRKRREASFALIYPHQREAVPGFPLKRKKEGVERSFRHA